MRRKSFDTDPDIGGGGFNKYAAGRKHYGGGRRGPNVGRTKSIDGYRKRDHLKRTRGERYQKPEDPRREALRRMYRREK